MGIQQTKSLLKNYYSKPSSKDPDSYLQKGFCPEALQIMEFLDNFWDNSANEHFDWTNIQENKKFEEIQKEKEKFYNREKYILPELPENKMIRESIFSIETLSENKEAYNPIETKYFSDFFIKKMNIILFAYVKKIISTSNESNSLDCIAKYFNSTNEAQSKVIYDMGMNIFLKMLEDQTLNSKNQKLKSETLDFMLNTMIFVRPLNFFMETKEFFMLDKSLDQLVNYLKKIVVGEHEEKSNRIKAYKIMLNLGLAKGSLKNLLDFVKYYDYLDDFIDLNNEINIFKNEFIKLSLSHPSGNGIICKSKLWNFKLTPKKKKDKVEDVKTDQHYSITNDGSFIYIFGSNGNLIKIGTGYNNTMLGNVYLLKEKFRIGENGTIVFIENVIYYRSSALDPDPLICIDPESFNDLPINYNLNTREPNHLWIESKKNEFEFPHNTFKDMNEIIEKKKNMGAEEKPNQRCTTTSPMTTDGRYLYIISKWFDDYDSNLEKAADDDDDEPKNVNKKPILSIYGVDVYDPLNNMTNVKSVKLSFEKKQKVYGSEVENTLPDLLAPNTYLYTNGNIIVIGMYKFSLITGEELEKDTSYDVNYNEVKSACYDLINNVIWGISVKNENNTDKIELMCYFNHSAKPILEYPNNHPKYMPCSLEKIIYFAEEKIKLENLTEKISVKKFERENTLNILNLEDNDSENYKAQNLTNNSQDNEKLIVYKKSVKCLILSTIAKLSEYYGQVPDIRSATTDEQRGLIFSKACRRPYCVKLESEIFQNLIVFINNFSESFFTIFEKKSIDKKDNFEEESDTLNYLDSYCLLSTIKILRTNLSCLSISNLDLKFFIKDKDNNPFLKVKEFIFKILEIYNKKISHYEKNKQELTKLVSYEKKNFEIIKALYEECKIILLVSVDTLYPDYNDIIEILEREILNFKISNYSRDVVNSILEWMSSEENMKNLLAKLKNAHINRIFEIFRTVSGWEIKNFSDYLINFKDFNTTLPRYNHTNNDEITAFKFSSNMQKEILKTISKKLLNENYDEIDNELLLQSFSEIIFENVFNIFQNLRLFLEKIKNLIKLEYNKYNRQNETEKFIDDDEVIDTSLSPQTEEIDTNKNENKEDKNKINNNLTLEEYSKVKIKEIWSYIMDKIISNNLLIIKIFNFHIDSLSILASNFIISCLMLNSFNGLIREMNSIHKIIKELEGESNNISEERSEYKEIIIESDHPYLNNQTKWFTIDIPGEKEIYLEFDPLCNMKENCAYVSLFTDKTMLTYVFPNFTRLTTNVPQENLVVSNAPIELYFYSDSCANTGTLYGFRLKVHNGNKKSSVIINDKFSNLVRSVCWVSCKATGQLLRGNFTKAISSGNDEDDIKYNNLLNSKLFAGGLEFDEIRKENDQNISNVLDLLEKIIPESDIIIETPGSITEKALLYKVLNGDDENINKLISLIQKKFSEDNVWGHIGGANADRLVRAAFAALLRHSGQAQDFKEILDILEFNEENNEDNLEIDKNVIIANITNSSTIYKHPKFSSIYKKWQAASRMRTWLVEKKKNVDEALEKSKPSSTLKKDESNGNNENQNDFTNQNNVEETTQIDGKNKDSQEKIDDNNSEEIMNKIIDQTVIKAKFLIKLNPSPAFVETEEKKHQLSSVLIRTSSIQLSENNEDNWKTRLNQWKILQKSRKVLRSVEEEANEKLTSLTSSVLLTLQSTISSKRLFNKIKIAAIRAKAREIGLITLKNTFQDISHTSLVKDLLSWFCASLRKTDSKICHYLDNLSGCGRHFEHRIEASFHEFIILLIQKLISVEDPLEVKSFVDALMWRYSSVDHKFLVDQSLFLILWGSYNTAMKSAWGKPLKSTVEIPTIKEGKTPNFEFTKDVLELFEILANICLEKATISQNDKQRLADKNLNIALGSKAPINIKFPNLERTVSNIDDNSSESLITHILDVIFGEASNAVYSYLKFRGISYRLWEQYEQYEEEKFDEKKKKKKTTNRETSIEFRGRGRGRGRSMRRSRRYSESFEGSEISGEHYEEDDDVEEIVGEESLIATNILNNSPDNSDDKKKEDEENIEEKPYICDQSDKICLYDELRTDMKGVNMNSKSYITVNELLNLVYMQNENTYDPEFLNRLLIVLYKCSLQHQNEKILFNIANPLSFCVLFKLIRICSTPEKILIAKILINVCPNIPEEILIEGIDLFLKDGDNDAFIFAFSEKRSKYDSFDKNIFLEFLIDLIADIRIKCWNKEIESSGCLVVSTQLISLLRILWQNENWKESVNNLFKNITDMNDLDIKEATKNLNNFTNKVMRKDIILGIFGGEYVGLSIGVEVRVKNEISQNNIDLDFIKREFSDHYNVGTILGFSGSMEDIWCKKPNKENKNPKKNKKSNSIFLTPNNTNDSLVCVLLNDSILKDEFNLIDILPKIYQQNELIVSQKKINFENLDLTVEDLEKILLFVIEDKIYVEENKKNGEVLSSIINLKTNYVRFLDKFLKTSKGISLFSKIKPEIVLMTIKNISEISTKNIKYGNFFLNLELLEEKRYRLINYCLENKTSLNELDIITVCYRKPNHLIFRINKDYLINLTYQICGVSNYELLNKLFEFTSVGIDKNAYIQNKLNIDDINFNNNDKIDYIITPFENIEFYLIENKKTLIITNAPFEGKFNESRYKKYENTTIIVIDSSAFKEIVKISHEIIHRKIDISEIFPNICEKKQESININNLNNENDIVPGNASKSTDDILLESTIAELKDFGFDQELIKTEMAKMKDAFNLNDLIGNLIEYKEKAKENKTDEENFIENIEINVEEHNLNEIKKEISDKKVDSDEIDDEVKNDCFNTKEEEKKTIIPDYFDEMLISEKADNYLIYKLFKSTNEKIFILYSRRILITLITKFVDILSSECDVTKNFAEFLITNFQEDSLLKNLKLLTNEGLFSNSINHGSDLLLQIKDLLIKLFSNKTNTQISNITEKLTKNTITELEKIQTGKLENYDFVIHNEETILHKPLLFFSIWNLMILNECTIHKVDNCYMFNVLSGVVMKIKDNKQIRWFLLDLLIQFTNKLINSLKDDYSLMLNLAGEKSLKGIENINKLRVFLDESIAKESKKNLSKRTQMITELLIYLEELESKINQLSGVGETYQISNLLEANFKKDNFIVDLLTTFEMMKEFFDKKYLKYLAWTEMNPDIINSSKLNFESSHLYPKAPHTFLLNIPNSISLDLNIFSDTLLDNGDSILFSLDKNGNYPIEFYANRSSKKNFSINSSHVFVHFPAAYLNEIYSFGSNGYSRLGHSGNDIYVPKLVESLCSYIIKDVFIGDTFVIILTNGGELYACGSGIASGLKQASNTFVKASNINIPEKLGSNGLSAIAVNQGATIAITKDYNFYCIGSNTYGQIGQGWNSPINEITSMNFNKIIKQITIGDTHTMMITNDGLLYHIGNNDYYQSGEFNTTRNNTPKLLELGKELICECVSAGEYFTIFVMKNIITKKTKLYSSGYNKNGRNGVGKDDDSYQVFKLIPCLENEQIEFKSCFSSKLCSGAISTTGKLYTWGQNTKGNLCFGHFNNILEPTMVTFFDKFEVQEVSMSVDHTLVLVKDPEKNKISVYGCGDYSCGMLGETITQKTEKKDCLSTPIKISYFEGKNPFKIITGPRASIVMCKVKSFEEIRDVHSPSIECSLCSKSPIVGNMFIEIFNQDSENISGISFLKENELMYYCNECIKITEITSKLPRLLIKAPLKDYSVFKDLIKRQNLILKMDSTNPSNEENQNCKNCKDIIDFSKEGGYQYLENKTISSLCNKCIDFYPSCITSAKVYLKTFYKFKNVDITNINLYCENSISYGHKFSITPVLNEIGCETIIEKNINSFNNFIDEINDFNKFDVYEQLVDLLNNISQKLEKSIFTYQPSNLSFKKEELSVRGSLEKSSPDVLRKMFVILKILNVRVKELLPYIDFSKVLQDNQRLSYHFNKITPLIFWDTKNEIIKFYLEKTCAEYETSEMKINRMKARRFIEKGKPDHTGEYTVFGQMYQFLKTKSFKIFKKKEGGNNNKMFNVTFVGEASIDAGGPYREALTQACAELQSSALPLFIPSPNQKNESGLFREKWIINPSAKSTNHLEMYKYFGGLIGYAMRTGEFLNLDLPSIFWKRLLGASVERKDLELIDRYTIQCLDDIINIQKKGISPQNFSFIVEQKFTTCLSDGSEVELIEDGKNIDVIFANRIKYCELVEKIRLEESKVQIDAIRNGLEYVIPVGLLKLLSWKELETLVCGKPILDIELLKENTVYRGCSETEPVIQNLWKCLEEFSAEERSMYLRFVWGRSRLPLTSKDFPMKHRIEILHHNNPNVALPTSHTCFFSLEIPKYSSIEILKEKLKYAITHCQAIDTDGRPYEIWQDED